MTKRPLEEETYTVDLANTEIKFYEKQNLNKTSSKKTTKRKLSSLIFYSNNFLYSP